MSVRVVTIEEKFTRIEALHTDKIIARMNDYHFTLVRMRREFIWHRHPETDEVLTVP